MTTNPTTPPTNVQADPAKAKKMTIYFIAVSLAGAALITASAVLGWGFIGFAGGGVMLLGGVGGFFGLKATGGVGRVTCPRCQHESEVMQLDVHRYLCCPGCSTWLEGARAMKPVEAGHIAPTPTFTVPVPDGPVRWPEAAGGGFLNPSGSPLPCLELRTIEGRRTPTIGLVAPVRVSRVVRLEAPWKKDDPEAVSLRLDPVPTLAFRSFDYLQAFKAANG
ncbi:MAG: hypothetical protein U1F43_03135 [Myxococcota bacterium]